MAETIRPKNYTDEMVAEMHELYTANPTRETVDMIAEKTPVNTIAVKRVGSSCSAAFGNKCSGSSNPGKSACPLRPNKIDEE